ncbi:uncharacterized protein LOC124404703 [Diprion similis]|uniref:uncharacterized protein LOC124404703 n=1 Tax=Diprion similis TaxID=362088 RepID=UPI001EF79E32|nr:uncharacterized protein LOC124404703 [Diprion similis]
MAEVSKKSQFVVVEFEEKCDGEEPSFDVVPRSWLIEEESMIQCFYPKKGSINKIRKWASEKKSPEDNWGIYQVTRIVCEAKNWEQGLRRLNKTLESSSINTDDTQIEFQDTQELAGLTSEEEMSQTLRTQQALPSIGDETLMNNLLLGNITIVPESNNNTEILKDFNTALEEMEDRIIKAIKSQKRSLQYDMDKKIDELKFMLSGCANLGTVDNVNKENNVRAQLGVTMPIKTLEEFLAFNDVLAVSAEKRESLKKMIRFVVGGNSNFRTALNRALLAIFDKEVQLHYSGCGRRTKNQPGKLPFVKTVVFICIKDVFLSGFANDVPNIQALVSNISRWLAGAGDRDGGRALRLSTPNNGDVENPRRSWLQDLRNVNENNN